ncbi:MAG: hypothetical protein AB7L09_21450 [Nitrospira sp.]
MPLPDSLEFVAQHLPASQQKGAWPHVSLGFDPGHTTGCALIHNYRLVWARQLDTRDIPGTWANVSAVFDEVLATYNREAICLAVEDYKVYDWKTESHSWSKVHTIKVVGLIQCLAYHHNLMVRMRMASAAKGFMTDTKLRQWGLWVEGQRHARDAIRHAAYNTLFMDSHISD